MQLLVRGRNVDVPETVQAADVPMLCVFWITNVSPAVKFAGELPPPARTVFQLASVLGATLPCE